MKNKASSTPWLGLLMALIALSDTASAASGHGDHQGPTQSLVPACRKAGALPSHHCGRTPVVRFDAQGRLWAVFSQNGHLYLSHSDDGGKTFTPPLVINRIPETIADDGENRPKLVLGDEGEVYVSWTVKTPGRYSGNVRFARSLDNGAHFDAPVTINDDRALISHRFDSMVRDSHGRVYLVWIDKRDLAAAENAGAEYAGAALYYTFSDDRGQSFVANRKLVDHSCECCRIALDVDQDDRVVALWRHVYPTNLRDHAIGRIDVAETPIRGEPVRATDDGWVIDGCPHHGPDISLSPHANGASAHITWFTQGEKNRGLMYGRFNLETGRLENQQSIDATAAASRPQILATVERVWRAWKTFDGEDTLLLASHSQDDGRTWSTPATIAKTANGSDHPDLLSHDNEVFLSWHTQSEGFLLFPLEHASKRGPTK